MTEQNNRRPHSLGSGSNSHPPMNKFKAAWHWSAAAIAPASGPSRRPAASRCRKGLRGGARPLEDRPTLSNGGAHRAGRHRRHRCHLAAHNCQDITLLINNAGVLQNSPMLSGKYLTGGAPRNGGALFRNPFDGPTVRPRCWRTTGCGVILNVLSVASWFTDPCIATYCASKAAQESLTDAIRMQLRSQGTHVAGVYAGYIDTDMTAHIKQPKTSPSQVVDRSLVGLESGLDRIFADL